MGWFENLTEKLRLSLTSDIDGLVKGDADKLPETPQTLSSNQGAIGQRAILEDPYYEQASQHFLFRTKMSRISNKTLKDTSLKDWLVSSIIQARCDTMLRFARPQRKVFDMGFKIFKKDRNQDITAAEREEMEHLEDYIYHCGRTDNVPQGEDMLFGEFLKLCTRDALTFGHIAVEKILTRRQALHRFRPVPGEAVYLVNQKTNRDIVAREIQHAREFYVAKQRRLNSADPSQDFEFNAPDLDYFKYVQMSFDNRVLAAFGDEDMVFKLFNAQNFADSMGYCYSPLELAIINITNHLQVENYNAQFFTYGYAARGILHLKGTVTQAQLAAFRRQFYNNISGTQNAWRTPIISGMDDVQWVPLSGGAKEMEYLNYNNHILRAVCTQFQIDPVELGLDYLISSNGRGAMQQASNEYKITYSRERGLIPLLMMFEDMMNSNILPALDQELSAKYEFKFTGYDDDSPQTNVALQQAQMTVFASLNDLLRSEGKEPIKQAAADLPLNQSFWGLVEKNMTRGEIRELFFGDKGASKKRELQYIPADSMFLGWQQLLLTIDQQQEQLKQQKEQMEQQAKQQQEEQQHQMEIERGRHQREQELHDIAMDEHKAKQAHAAVSAKHLKDIAKEYGAASKPLNVGGTPVANPINNPPKGE